MSLDAIGVICDDVTACIKFYETLGLSFTAFGDDGDHFEAVTPSGMRLMLDSVELIKKLNPDWEQPPTSSVVLAFKQETPAQVDEVFKKLTDAGHQVVREPWDAFWGQRYANVKDPNGNIIDLFADLPTS